MYVGVIPLKEELSMKKLCIPHVRGGDPTTFVVRVNTFIVFPMYVGVILSKPIPILSSSCIPHVRGGDPLDFADFMYKLLYSPCTWG